VPLRGPGGPEQVATCSGAWGYGGAPAELRQGGGTVLRTRVATISRPQRRQAPGGLAAAPRARACARPPCSDLNGACGARRRAAARACHAARSLPGLKGLGASWRTLEKPWLTWLWHASSARIARITSFIVASAGRRLHGRAEGAGGGGDGGVGGGGRGGAWGRGRGATTEEGREGARAVRNDAATAGWRLKGRGALWGGRGVAGARGNERGADDGACSQGARGAGGARSQGAWMRPLRGRGRRRRRTASRRRPTSRRGGRRCPSRQGLARTSS
jgi:hypothetical protein